MKGWTYADCPGIYDPQGAEQRIKNSFYIKELFKNNQPLRFVIVEPADQFKVGNERGAHLLSTLENFAGFFQSTNISVESLTLVVSHHTKSHSGKIGLRGVLTSLADQEKDQSFIKNVLLHFSKNEHAISFFPSPFKEGDYNAEAERLLLLENIGKTQPIEVDFKNVKISLDASSQILVEGIKKLLIKDLNHLIKSYISDQICKIIKEEKNNFTTNIESKLKEVMRKYSPFVIAFPKKVTSRSYDQLLNFLKWSQTAKGATSTSLIGASGAGIMGTFKEGIGKSATLIKGSVAALALPYIGITPVIAAGAAGLAGYWIDKKWWETKQRSALQIELQELLKKQFMEYSRILRRIKYGFTKENLLEFFKKESGIITALEEGAQALKTICFINNENYSSVFKDSIWENTLKETNRKLRLNAYNTVDNLSQARTSDKLKGQNFYDICQFEELWDQEKDNYPLRLGLSIDGGGMRGLIPALYLQEIEAFTHKPLFKLFDILGGTSIGGIIGLGIVAPDKNGKAKHTASDFVDLFRQHGSSIFPSSNFIIKPLVSVKNLFKPKFSSAPLEKILLEKFEDIYLSQALKPILVPAINVNKNNSYTFDSIKAKRGTAHDFFMRDTARATSAAPTYFPAANFDSIVNNYYNSPKNFIFADGGPLHNNPSEQIFDKLIEVYKDKNKLAIISLDTGFGPDVLLKENSGIIGNVSPLIETMSKYNEYKIRTNVVGQLGPRYIRVSTNLEENIDLSDASEATLETLEIKAEKKLNDIEEIARFLLINYDSWEDMGKREELNF